MVEARVFRWALFVTLLCTWPLPLYGLEGSSVPVARFAQLGIGLSILMALEGGGGMVGPLFLLLWGHVLVYSLLLFGVTSVVVSHGLARLPGRLRGWVAATVIAALVCWTSFASPYDSIFHHSDAHASLLDLYR